MTNSRERFDAIEPRGGLARVYEALEGYGERLTADDITRGYEAAMDYLVEVGDQGRRLFVTFQADATVVVTDANEQDVMDYEREVDDPLVQTEYEMVYGEVDGFRVQEYPGHGGPYLVAEVVTHEFDSNKREFDVYMAMAGEWGPYATTKLHEMEDMYPTEPEHTRHVDQFKHWLHKNKSADGKSFQRWIRKMRRNGAITDLDEWMTAINRALIDDFELSPMVRAGGNILLLRSQLSAHTAPEMRSARDEELELMAIIVRELDNGVIKGELYCFDPLSRRIGQIPLSQKGMMLGCRQPDNNIPNSDL